MTDNIYPGEPWHADESEDCVRIFRGSLQIVKAPKCDTPFEEYWPDPSMLTWMLAALNSKEKEVMKCPSCEVEMKHGIGINPTTPDWLKRSIPHPEPYITHENITLDKVWKCAICGHSADLQPGEQS
ncbi:hypothetical protein UFOVP29_327 [uncultured Caudovirales phage]|uniref:Uncharacterized protein n=1 Tax=uncultured Caudovirales phage TaxID=2100421 RepID=A0A6J5KLQ7_9CAUD|nr:hypothetical protein UFOVP29_327 [uncultured Caudovirales phage]